MPPPLSGKTLAALDGIHERVVAHSCAIYAAELSIIGSGVVIKLDGRLVILTAGHVFKSSPDLDDIDLDPRKLRFVFKPSNSVTVCESKPSGALGKQQASAYLLPLTEILHHNKLDVCALRLPLEYLLPETVIPYELSPQEKSPRLKKTVTYLGHPEQYSRLAGPLSEMTCVADWSRVVGLDHLRSGQQCNPKTHLLIEDIGSREEQRNPRGFSGGGIWFRKKPDQFWTPEVFFGGIITHHFRSSHLFKAVRAEQIARILCKGFGAAR